MRRDKVPISFLIILLLKIGARGSLKTDEDGTCQDVNKWELPSKTLEKFDSVNLRYVSKSDERNLCCTARKLHNIGIRTELLSNGCLESHALESSDVSFCLDQNGAFVKKLPEERKRRQRFDMMGRELKVLIVSDIATVMVEDEGAEELVATDGLDYRILTVLAEKLNFTTKYLIPNNDDPKYANSTRTWPAAYDMIEKKKGDLFISHISMNTHETDIVDFTTPYIVESVVFVGKLPGFASKAHMLLKPFELKLWIALIVAYVLFGIALQQIFYWEYKLHGGKKPSWKETFWYLSTTLLNQVYGNLERVSSRLVMILWLFMIFILTMSYSGILTSFMSLPIRYPPVDTLPALEKAVHEKRLTCLAYKGSLQYVLITRSNTPSQRAIRQSLKENSVTDVLLMLEYLKAGKSVVIGEEVLVEMSLADLGKERFYTSKDTLSNNLVSMAIRKEIPMKKAADIVIRRMTEAGLVDKWKKDFIRILEKPPTEELDDSDLGGTQVAFILLIAGYVISFASLILEMFISKFKRRS